MRRFNLIARSRERIRLGVWRNTATTQRTPGTIRPQRSSVTLGQLASVFEKMSAGERTTNDIRSVDNPKPADDAASALRPSHQRTPSLPHQEPQTSATELSLSLPLLRSGGGASTTSMELSMSVRTQLTTSLQGLPNNALVLQLADASSRRDAERGPLLLFELLHRVEAGRMASVSMSALFSILRLLASFHRPQLEACVGDVVRLRQQAETGEDGLIAEKPGGDWVSRLWTMIGVILAENCSEFSYAESLRVLHLLSCTDGFFVEGVCETLVDNVRIYLSTPTPDGGQGTGYEDGGVAQGGRGPSAGMNELGQLSMLLDSIALHAVHCKTLLVRQRETTGAYAGSSAPSASDNAMTSLAQMLHQTRHPVANEEVFMLVTHRLAALVNTRQGEHVLHDGVSPATMFFMLRALSNAPWINNACIHAIIQRLPSSGPAARGAWKGVVLLLGRREVTVTDARVVDAVLRSMVDEVQSFSSRSPPSLWIGFARLTALLVYVQHMLKVCFTKLHQDGATETLKSLQGSAKLFYSELCDNVLRSARSIDDLCKARVIVTLLHHLLYAAPRSVGEQHPLIRHLAFAMTQTVPTLRLLADPARERIQLSVERLQELGILNDGCEMAEENFVKFPLLREAALRALERKAQNFWRSSGGKRPETDDQSSAVHGTVKVPEAPALQNLTILFVQFRKHVNSWN